MTDILDARDTAPGASPPRTPVKIARKEAPNLSPMPTAKPATPTSNIMWQNRPNIRMQDVMANPVSISPPRAGVPEPASARMGSSPSNGSQGDSRRSSRDAFTPDSALRDSISNLSLIERPTSAEMREGRAGGISSRQSSGSHRLLDDLPEDETLQPEQQSAPLQYHHQLFDDSPVKRTRGTSQASFQSAHSSPGGGEQGAHLRLPRGQVRLPRPGSTQGLSPDSRGRLSPRSMDGSLVAPSPSGSPKPYARAISSNRRSPDPRPVSYIDLLNEVPYSQQVAPAPTFNNLALQSAVGSNASLLDTKKTLDMYRVNVKKTNDPAIQYEFAIFMVNTARDAIGRGETVGAGSDSAAEMIKEARNILQKLSDRAYPFAQYYLADGFFSGFFNKDKPDFEKAFPLFVAASKHGHAEAGYRAALCYEFGWGTAKSYPKAVQFFRNAASKGHPGAAARLGKACLTGDMGLMGKQREGIKWLKRAQENADVQYNTGPYELGLLHVTGYSDDIFKDEAYAAQLLTRSAELGHVDANYRMGQAYELGLLGCPRDAALSVHFYNGAASRGMPEAMMALCAWYMVGAEPVLEKDEGEACEWARRAAETGMPKAEYAVGYFTEMGIGCRRDPLEANMWYVRAADQGDDKAKQRLAIIRAAASGDSPGTPMTKANPKSKDLGSGKEKECVVM